MHVVHGFIIISLSSLIIKFHFSNSDETQHMLTVSVTFMPVLEGQVPQPVIYELKCKNRASNSLKLRQLMFLQTTEGLTFTFI